MDCYDVGDVATFTLTVDPAAGDTAATVAITDPAGAAVAATPTPNTSKSRWTANATLTSAGVWEATWTVTGTGAGVQTVQILVRPTPSTLPGRSYATTADLAGYLGCAPAAKAGRRLVRATEVLDDALRGGCWPVDDDGMPTDAGVAAALRDAVCAQVEWWESTGDPDGLGLTESWDQVQIGSVKLARSGGSGSAPQASAAPVIAPDAVRRLRNAGLIPINPWVVG